MQPNHYCSPRIMAATQTKVRAHEYPLSDGIECPAFPNTNVRLAMPITDTNTDDQRSFDLIRQGGKMREQGMAALWRKYADPKNKTSLLWKLIRKSKNKLSEEDADEIMQETFIKVVRHCESYKSDSPFEAWLWRIAINCMIDHFRSVKSRSTTEADKAADKIKKGAIALEHATATEAGESRVQGGVNVTELRYAGESEAKSHRTPSPPMFISIDNDWDNDESDGLTALEGQFNSLWKYDPDTETGLFENCIDQGYAEFARRFNERWYALSLTYDGYDTAYIAEAIQRTPGATREFLSQTRKRIEEFLLPCQEYR